MSRLLTPLLWLSALCPLLSAAAKPQSDGTSRSPNIILVLTDDQRWDAMGFMGHPFLETPHMDRLAREGAHFENAFVTTSLCSPSRASILTGLYAHNHRVVDNYNPLPENLVFFSAVPAGRRIRDRVCRQMAHGRRNR